MKQKNSNKVLEAIISTIILVGAFSFNQHRLRIENIPLIAINYRCISECDLNALYHLGADGTLQSSCL